MSNFQVFTETLFTTAVVNIENDSLLNSLEINGTDIESIFDITDNVMLTWNNDLNQWIWSNPNFPLIIMDRFAQRP